MIDLTLDGPVAEVRIDRRERLNALDDAASARLREIWRELAARAEVRAAIVTAAGERAFCAGADLKDGHVAPRVDPPPVGGLTKDLPLFKPVIAAVNGLAYGGGLELMLATDLRVAVPEATFALPETRWGLIPGGGGTVRLPYNVPWAIASEMILRGRVLDAEEALRFGLVNALAPRAELLDVARGWAHEIAARGPFATRTAKEVMWRSRGMDPDVALRMEERFSYATHVGAEAAEGVAAFAERRPARFADA